MMTTIRCLLVLGVCLLLCASAHALVLTWDGGGDGTSWDGANWDYAGLCGMTPCYPSTTEDEAIIGDDCDTCIIDLVEEQIDELYVVGGGIVAFDDGDASNPELNVSAFLAGDDDDSLTIRVRHGAVIKHVSGS